MNLKTIGFCLYQTLMKTELPPKHKAYNNFSFFAFPELFKMDIVTFLPEDIENYWTFSLLCRFLFELIWNY